MRKRLALPIAALALLGGYGSGQLQAASITFNLVCVLNALNTIPCNTSGPIFGTVTLTDNLSGGVVVDVDLAGTTQKFRDLMLNFSGAATSLSSSDGLASLSANGFSISPYSGLFDVGKSSGQGWNGDDLYSTTLTGNVAISVADFLTTDSLGNVYVAMHIQGIGDANGGDCTGDGMGGTNCVPGMPGPGSLKIGGILQPNPPEDPIPEPTTWLLVGGGLALLGARRFARK